MAQGTRNRRRAQRPTQQPAKAAAAGNRAVRLGAAILVTLGVLTYWNSLDAPFMFDDQNSIIANGQIRQLWPLTIPLSPPRDTPVAGRPLVNFTFALNYASGGLAVRGYHAGNLALHLLAALALFGLVRRTLALGRINELFTRHATGLAWACAVVWTIHPLQTEVVDYLSERSESLMALCYLLTLYCAVRAHRSVSAKRWTIAAIAACAAGMAGKESMVTAPVMVLLFDRIFLFDSLRDAIRQRRGLYLGLSATWSVLGALLMTGPRTSAGFGSGVDAWTYLLNQAEIIPRYLWLSIWPRALVLDYGLPRSLTVTDVILPGALLVALGLLTIAALWYRPAIGFLGAWLFITLAPTSSFVPIATEVGAERRMYLPLAALVVLGVLGMYWIGDRLGKGPAYGKAVAAFVLACVCALLITGTFLRNREYESRLTMARTIVERRPNGRGYFLFANELLGSGRTNDALAQFRLSSRDYPPAHYGLGTELVSAGKLDEGIEHLQEFIRLMPDNTAVVPARELIGRAFAAQGQFDRAAEQFTLALRQSPNDARVHGFLGDLRLRQGRREEAIRELEAAIARDPANVDVLRNLGIALAESGRLREAIPMFTRAVNVDPTNPGLHTILGRALAADQRFADAATEFRRVVALAPDDAAAKRNLASLESLAAKNRQ